LKRVLVKAGLPATAPTRKTARGSTIGVAIGAGAGVAAAAGLLALLYRRRSASD
jgi:nitrate reductase gamma subunit